MQFLDIVKRIELEGKKGDHKFSIMKINNAIISEFKAICR